MDSLLASECRDLSSRLVLGIHLCLDNNNIKLLPRLNASHFHLENVCMLNVHLKDSSEFAVREMTYLRVAKFSHRSVKRITFIER